jgi:16S rRNA (uracil1498-N3)-methyltransferase
MQYLYNIDSGKDSIVIQGDSYRYLFKVRRLNSDSILELRNLKDKNLYLYRVVSIDKKSATLALIGSEEKEVKPAKDLTIGWCIIDPKIIEKNIASLNEIGVSKIVFIKCAYSQANFKITQDRLNKILINSSQQCGRSSLMSLEFSNSIADFLRQYPNSYLLDFSETKLESNLDINSIVIGCEGGISKDERALFKQEKTVGLNTPQILKSESAAISVAAKILL